MKIVTVIPLEKGAWKTDLTYFTTKDIDKGSIVVVPIRNKKILALVVSLEDVAESKGDVKDMPFLLKKILEVKDHSIFRDEFLEAALELSSYFVAKENSAMISLIPAIFREKYDEIVKFSKLYKGGEARPSALDLASPDSLRSSLNIKIEKLLFQTKLEDRIAFYKTFIRGYFAQKKSVFLILPTEYDIEIFEKTLSRGVENFTFAIHNGLKPARLLEIYEKIMYSTHGVLILCTPQFLSIPRSDVGAIILEKESSGIYKMVPKPHFDLRIFAELYASKIKAKFILSDTLLRFDTIARKDIDNLGEVYPMSFRTNFDGKINIFERESDNQKRLPDGTVSVATPRFRVLGKEILEEIYSALKDKKNVFVFSLRKGLATYTVCKDCGEAVSCENCLAPVVLYLSRDSKKRMFVCNRCNTEKDPETTCSNCGSWNLTSLGIGTDTILEELKNEFQKNSGIKIFKLDKESAKTSKEAEKIIKDFENTRGSILIGTEMAFFYLKEKIHLSVVASFDSLWSIPNFKMGEKVIQLLLSIIYRTENKILIQTKNIKDMALQSIKSENLLPFVREELEDRKNLGYPPFKRFIKITCVSNKAESPEIKKMLSEILKDYNPEIFSGFVSKNTNEYATNALIKIEPYSWSLPDISIGSGLDKHLKKILSSLVSTPDNKFEISVDPEDLL